MKTSTYLLQSRLNLTFVGVLSLVAVIDIILVVASSLAAVGTSNRVINQLNLGIENNAAVWWSSATLFIAALLFFDAACRSKPHRLALLALALLLTFLSLDEMGSLHERIFTGSYWSYVPYALVGGLLFLFAFWQLYKDESTRNVAVIIFLGFSCFGTVVLQEYFEHNVDWPVWAVGFRVGIEEGTELLGTALCLLAAGRLLAFDGEASLRVPVAHRDARYLLIAIVLLGICAGCYAAIKAPSLGGYPGRGNPALWFAMVTFLYLVYEVLRAQELLAGIVNNVVVVLLAVLASMAQTMFVYTKFDLSTLLVINVVLSAGIALTLAWKYQSIRIHALAASVLILMLGLGASQGADSVAFVFSFAAALGLIFLNKKAVATTSSQKQVGTKS